MRVIISAESFLPRSNGVTNSVFQVLANLKRAGHQPLVVAPGQGPSEVLGVQILRVPALSVSKFAQIDIARVRVKALREIIHNFAPDVAHLASPFILGEQLRKAAADAKIPTVAIYQTDVTGFANFYGLSAVRAISEARIKKIHQAADLTLAPSSSSISYLNSLGINRVKYWGRGVEHAQFCANHRSKQLRRGWGADDQSIVIGYVGRVAPEKQIEKLLALSDLGRLSGRKIRLVVVGDGPSREKLQKQLPDAHFTGSLSGFELGQAMASLDILLSTGEHETFCQVIQEGMAAGVAVVAAAAGGPLDLVQVGQSGELYAPGSISQMRRSLLRLITDDQLRRSYGAAGEKLVQGRSWQLICQQLFDHYQAVIDDNLASRPIRSQSA